MRKFMAEHGPPPGLRPWLKETVVLLRCRDINQTQFRDRVMEKVTRAEALLDQAQPKNVDPEQYQLVGNYYPVVSQCLSQYLSGLDELLHWSETGGSAALERAEKHIETGDLMMQEVVVLICDLNEQFRETEEALIQALSNSPGNL